MFHTSKGGKKIIVTPEQIQTQEWVASGDDTMELNEDLFDSDIFWFFPDA